MKRLNPVTKKQFKHGDKREDGFIFRRYKIKRPLTSEGYFQEHWLSPNIFTSYTKKNFNHDKKKADKNRSYIQQIKLNKGCECCGYNLFPEALDFDHIDPMQKHCAVGTMCLHSKEFIDKEIAKCRVLCSNCHRVKTYNPLEFNKMFKVSECL
jgi:hypothetical protein